MSKKVFGIIEGIAIIALGVLIAIFGGQAVLDLYFGILFIIASAGLIAFSIATLVKTGLLNFLLVFLALAAGLFGSFLLANYYSFGYIMYTLVLLIIAAGGALVLYGVYVAIKFNVFYGVGQSVVGAALATLGICYVFVDGFAKYFWIITGALVAAYGLFYVIASIFRKDESKVIEQ